MKVFTEKELAAYLSLSVWTIRNWRIKKKLPHFRTAGRIFYRISSIERWMEEQEAEMVIAIADSTPHTPLLRTRRTAN